MNIFLAVGLFIAGLGLVIYFAEKLVKGTVSLSSSFGISAFVISVIFIGFDPENLFVGAAGSFQGVSGIASGSIIGAAMVSISLALGITALFAPVKFEKVPKRIMVLSVLAVLLFGILSLDGTLNRIDGVLLIAAFTIIIFYLIKSARRGIEIKASGEVAETLEETDRLSKWKSLLLFIISLAAIIIGSEILVESAKTIISAFNISDTVFGMTILAFLVSVEEIARELPAALKGHSEISIGNVIGSVFAFFLFNAGIIAIISPFEINEETLIFYLPLAFITILFISLVLIFTKKISRLTGIILIIFYIVFIGFG